MLCYKYSGIFSNCPIAISSFKNDVSKKSILFHLQSKIAILSYFRTVKVFISNLLRLSCRRLRLRIDFSPLLLIWFSKTTRKCRFRQLTICLWETLKSTELNHYQRFRHLRQSKFDFTKNLINFDFVYFSVIWLLKVPRWPLWPPRCPRPSMTQNEANCHHPWTSPKSNLNTFQL